MSNKKRGDLVDLAHTHPLKSSEIAVTEDPDGERLVTIKFECHGCGAGPEFVCSPESAQTIADDLIRATRLAKRAQ